MGFCLFNNVAIAARSAQRSGAERILIVDWDLHHGNGTQNSFWDDPSVVYVSTHQAPLYPGTGAIEETGGPNAAGRTINVPWPAGRGDADHLEAFDRVLRPIARRFQPDVTLVSAGFDAARGDLLGSQVVSPGGYAAMTVRLQELAGGRVVLALEGGYALEAISADAAACLETLLGDVPPGRARPPKSAVTGLDPRRGRRPTAPSGPASSDLSCALSPRTGKGSGSEEAPCFPRRKGSRATTFSAYPVRSQREESPERREGRSLVAGGRAERSASADVTGIRFSCMNSIVA